MKTQREKNQLHREIALTNMNMRNLKIKFHDMMIRKVELEVRLNYLKNELKQ